MNKVTIRELAAWGLDHNEYRPATWRGDLHLAATSRAERSPQDFSPALLTSGYTDLQDRLAEQRTRTDLSMEMTGLDWFLGVVDLRLLLAFQRRIVVDAEALRAPIPAADDWAGLVDLCFGSSKPVVCDRVRGATSLVLRSIHPNLHARFTDDSANPIAIHSGSPFFEVARYRDRWFLRDGYHRAFLCLRNGVCHLPAVIVKCRTLEELGAVHPWFFPEEALFSAAPPQVIDFLDDGLVIEYHRSSLIKTVRITVEEAYTLEGETDEHCNETW